MKNSNGSMPMDADRPVGRRKKSTGSLSQKLLMLGNLGTTSLYTVPWKIDYYQLNYPEISSSTGLMWALSKFISFPFRVLHGAWSKSEQGLSLRV